MRIMKSNVLVSIVVPVFNEQENLVPLNQQLDEQLSRLFVSYEVIFVDDGSGDESLSVLRGICQNSDHVRVVSLSRNFGHQIAVTAGMQHASGDAVIVMDADLQHPVELLPQMIAKWKEGFDVVYTVRTSTEGAGFFKRTTSRLFYKLMNGMTRTPIIPGSADFRLMDRKVVDSLNQMKEHSRFLRGMVSWSGFKQTGIPFTAARRYHGSSSYSVRSMIRFGLDGVTSFSSMPLRLSAILGLIAAFVGLPYGLWAIYVKLFTDSTVPGWTSLIVITLFLGGVQLICLGVIGEYIGRIYEEVKDRPLFLTQERLGFDSKSTQQETDTIRHTDESGAEVFVAKRS